VGLPPFVDFAISEPEIRRVHRCERRVVAWRVARGDGKPLELIRRLETSCTFQRFESACSLGELATRKRAGARRKVLYLVPSQYNANGTRGDVSGQRAPSPLRAAVFTRVETLSNFAALITHEATAVRVFDPAPFTGGRPDSFRHFFRSLFLAVPSPQRHSPCRGLGRGEWCHVAVTCGSSAFGMAGGGLFRGCNK